MYRVETDSEALEQLAALAAYAPVLSVLELVPWNGDPLNRSNPDVEVRVLAFGPHGEGMVTYLILEQQQRVDVLRVVWFG